MPAPIVFDEQFIYMTFLSSSSCWFIYWFNASFLAEKKPKNACLALDRVKYKPFSQRTGSFSITQVDNFYLTPDYSALKCEKSPCEWVNRGEG